MIDQKKNPMLLGLVFGLPTDRFCFARLDPAPARSVWFKEETSGWTKQTVPAYTLVALDRANDALHRFGVEVGTNKVFSASWAESRGTRDAKAVHEYKNLVYRCMTRWVERHDRDNMLKCDLDEVGDLIAWPEEV